MGLSERAPQPYKGSSETDISAHIVKLKDKPSAFFCGWRFLSFGNIVEYMFRTYFLITENQEQQRGKGEGGPLFTSVESCFPTNAPAEWL